MAVLSPRRRAGEFILSEANNGQSREAGTVGGGAGRLEAGTVLGRLSASGEHVPLKPGATDGSQLANAIVFASVDAQDGPAPAVWIKRNCTVRADDLVWPDGISQADRAASIARLAALGIALRYSGEVPAAAPAPTDAPASLSIGAIGSDQAAISYDPVAGATGYDLRFSSDGGSSWTLIGGIAASPYALMGLAAATAYRLQVRGKNGSGAGPWSDPMGFTTSAAPAEGPVFTTQPSVSGKAVAGQPLTADPGVATGTGQIIYTYQWLTD